MKKRILTFVLLLALVCGFAVPAFAASDMGYINDAVGLLTSEEYVDLENRAAAVSEEYGCGVYVLILDDYTVFGDNTWEATDLLYEDFDFGFGPGRDGFMLMLSMSARDYQIGGYGDFGGHALTDYGIELMEDAILDNLAEDDWYGGFADYIGTSAEFLQAARDGDPVDLEKKPSLTPYIVSLVIAVLIALFTCSVFKDQMKTAVKKTSASDYVIPGSVFIQHRSDVYSHTVTTRRKIKSDSDSSSSGSGSGSRSSGSGKF